VRQARTAANAWHTLVLRV